ncbi:J domain-containing protein [Skermanella pratensis]|uniref:J domain-containing protein n=1 Tax=Skermanella pratensis TaxID=2233999 RepID=UPI001300FA1B|nr:J domain-containing protein [Skermanella pratensis]
MRWKGLNQGYSDHIAALASKPPHEVLGVPADCPRDELKAAYIKLVKTYHPDTSDPFMARHNEEVIKIVNAAYKKIVGDASK